MTGTASGRKQAEGAPDRETVATLIHEHFDHLLREYEEPDHIEPAPLRDRFVQYYSWMEGANPAYHSAVLRTLVDRLWYPASLITARKRPRILDAGCGMGVESTFFASLGAEVVGVDLNLDYLEIARKRVQAFQQRVDPGLEVELRAQSVFDVGEHDAYDLIWVKEAISHIDPAEEFVVKAGDLLRSNGELIISEANGSCPLIALHTVLGRGLTWRSTVLDPATGRQIPFAMERVFRISHIAGLLRRSGLSVVHVEPQFHLRRFAGRMIVGPLAVAYERIARLVGLAGISATHYVISGRKR